MMRISDYLEDNDVMSDARKVASLQLWEKIVAGVEPPERLVTAIADCKPPAGHHDSADYAAACAAPDVIAMLNGSPSTLRNHLVLHVRATSLGMARWVERGPVIPAEPDMDDYMFEVAGRVGYLITDVFAWYSRFVRERLEVLMPLAREFSNT